MGGIKSITFYELHFYKIILIHPTKIFQKSQPPINKGGGFIL